VAHKLPVQIPALMTPIITDFGRHDRQHHK